MPADSAANPPKLFDRARLSRQVQKAWTGQPDFITQLVLDDLGDRLAPVTRTFEKALIMGPDVRALPEAAHSADAPIRFQRAATLVPHDGLMADPEALDLPDSDYDLIVSLLDLQIVNDVPGFLHRLHHHLKPDGLFLAAAVGGKTFQELRAAWLQADAEISGGAFARVAPFMDVRDAGGLLQRAGFALPVADVETHRIRHADPLALMRDIKALGAANPMAETPNRLATPNLLAAALRDYAERASDPDGRVFATLEILWLSGWSPHESQQKPLRPGSAQMNLKDVLGDKTKS